MLDPKSRYYDLPTAVLTVVALDGTTRQIRYLRRRFLPQNGRPVTLAEHVVAQGERLDNITARYLGDPTLFWQVCDVNVALQPEELEQMGRRLKIGMTGV